MADPDNSTAKKVTPKRRRRATAPEAGAGGIHQLAAAATATAEAMKNGDPIPGTQESATPNPEPDLKENTTAEPEQDNQEIKKSGQKAGNPENQKTRNHVGGSPGGNADDGSEGQPDEDDEEPYDYLGNVYGGVTDPREDFVKGSTSLPAYLWPTLKAAAAEQQTTIQRLLRDIILGKEPPLPQLSPHIERKFYRMAQRGQLRR